MRVFRSEHIWDVPTSTQACTPDIFVTLTPWTPGPSLLGCFSLELLIRHTDATARRYLKPQVVRNQLVTLKQVREGDQQVLVSLE